MDTYNFRIQKINELLKDGVHTKVSTNDLIDALNVTPHMIADWVKDFKIPFEYSKTGNPQGGSPIRMYEVKYVPLFVDISILYRHRRIDLVKLVLGNVRMDTIHTNGVLLNCTDLNFNV